MAIVAAYEILGARSGKIDAQWRRSYRRAWRVELDDPWTGALAIRQAIPVSIGNTYVFKDASGAILEHDTFAFAMSIEAQIDPACDDDCSWIVTVDYGPYDATQFPENPLDQPLRINWAGSRFERVVEETVPDDQGVTEAVLNSAGDYFDPPITIDDSRPTLRIVRNERTYDPHYAILWKDTLNKDKFFGFDAHVVKMSLPTGELEYNPICGFYYVVTYEFEVNPDGWRKRILDQGLKTWDGTSDKPSPCLDKDGDPVTSPVLLDGGGGQLKTGDDPVYLEYDVYEERDYSLLTLDPAGAPGQDA